MSPGAQEPSSPVIRNELCLGVLCARGRLGASSHAGGAQVLQSQPGKESLYLPLDRYTHTHIYLHIYIEICTRVCIYVYKT